MNLKISLKRILLIASIFCFFNTYIFAQEDSFESQHDQEILKHKNEDSFGDYFSVVNKIRKQYENQFRSSKNRNDRNKIAQSLFAFLKDIELYRDPVSHEEYLLVRRYYAGLIYWAKKSTGEISYALEKAIEASKFVKDPILLDSFSYFIERKIGIFYDIKGDESRAILYYNKCVPGLIKRKKHKQLSSLYRNLGDSYLRLKDFEKAKKNFTLAVDESKKINCLDCELSNRANLRNLAYTKRDYPLFVKLSIEDKNFMLTLEQKPKIVQRIINLEDKLGNYYYNHKDFEKALLLFRKVLNFRRSNSTSTVNRGLAKINLKIAQCLMSLQRKKEFRQEISSCYNFLSSTTFDFLPADSLLFAESNLIDIFGVNSDFFKKEYTTTSKVEYLDTAIFFLEKAIKVNELLDEKIIYSKSKTSFANESKIYVDLALNLAFQKHANFTLSNKDWIRLRNFFNASKDQILKDRLDLYQKINELEPTKKKTIDSLILKIANILEHPQPDRSTILEYQDQIELISGIKIDNSKHKKLESDYIEYAITNDNVYLFSNIDCKKQFLNLGKKDTLFSLIDSFNIRLENTEDNTNCNEILSQLSHFLLPESISLERNITIIPDGKITTIPFDILRRNNKYLFEDHVFNVSTHFLQKPIKKKNSSLNVLCVRPEYTGIVDKNEHSSSRSGFYPLPFAVEEVKFLQSLFSSSFKSLKEINQTAITQHLKEAKIFHFTGHAKVKQDSAFLVLNNTSGINKWSYEQIFHSKFDLSLVTLSACETGLGKVQYGDGLNSLARGFLGAGADAVVYSLWTVNDLSTSDIMKYFYAEIKKGIPKDEAIRNAKLNYYLNANPERRHPYFWGSFIAAGDMSPVHFDSSLNFQSQLLYILGGSILVLLLFKYIKKKHP